MPNPKFEDNRNPNDRTLRDVVDERLALFFECASCQRLSQSDLLELVWRFGPDTKIETIRFQGRLLKMQRPQSNAASEERLSAWRCRLVSKASACDQVRRLSPARYVGLLGAFQSRIMLIRFHICSSSADKAMPETLFANVRRGRMALIWKN